MRFHRRERIGNCVLSVSSSRAEDLVRIFELVHRAEAQLAEVEERESIADLVSAGRACAVRRQGG